MKQTYGRHLPCSRIIHCITIVTILSLSANVFPQTETHPFILYTSNGVYSIRENITTEPCASWFQQELVETGRILQHTNWWADDSVPQETRAYYAKVLAFVYAFADTSDASADNRATWARESALGLFHIPSGDYTSNFSSDLTISEAALFWAEAYDILKGAGFDFSIDGYENVESVIRSNMSALRDYMAKDYFVLFSSDKEIGSDYPSVAYFDGYADKLDNHHVKLYASLAVLALTVPEEDGSLEDFNHALKRLKEALNNMTITGDNDEPAGGWAEGPNYHLYSAHQYLAAVTALKNKEIADLYSDYPELINTHLYLPRTVMPDGFSPPVDDNEAVIFDMSGLLYSHHPALPERDMLLWMWDTAGRVINKAFRADYIAQFDNTPPVYSNPEEMGWNTSEFNPESGYARFRSSWNSDAVYLMLLCEHGEARKNGQAHEHPDPNTIILHAFGEMLLLDSGYGGWGERDATRFAENHNLILVNGEGPTAASQSGLLNFWYANGSDAYLTDYFSSPQIDYAVSETIYQNLNTQFLRHVIFPGKRYFFMYDTVSSGTEATYTLLLHGNGGGTSGGDFTQSENGAVWKHGEAALRTYTIGSVSPVQFDTVEMNHAVYNRSPMLTHTVLKASLSGIAAQYLTLLYPYPEGADIPDITGAPVINGKGICLAAADTLEYGLINPESNVMTLDDNGTVISSDSDFLYCRVEKGDYLQHFFFIGGTFVSTPEDTLVLASHTVNLSVDYSHPSYIEGYVQANEETELIFNDVQPSRVLYCGNEIPFNIEENNLIYTISGEGMFFIDLSETDPDSEPPVDVSVLLDDVVLPPGFKIDIYAGDVPDARTMAVSPDGTIFIGTRSAGKVYAVTDSDKNNKAENIFTIASGLNLPNGVAFRDGSLYVAEMNRILRFDDIEANLTEPPEPVVVNNNLPGEEYNGSKFIRFGPDRKLYVSVGSPCNACGNYDKRYATIMQMNPDGTDLKVFAYGIRNTQGFDWHPVNGEFWFTDNGRDGLGENMPPDELNCSTERGQHFGFPFCHGISIPDPLYGSCRMCSEFIPPVLELNPHVAASGMRFCTGNMFPEEYSNRIFIAEHGSPAGTVPVGYRIMLVRLKDNRAVGYEVFAEGWLKGESAWGSPVDVQFMPDGALLVSDDRAGVIYRISYSITTGVNQVPGEFILKAPYPNPFNAVTTINYEIPAECHVELVIYDILGKVVVVLEDAYMGSGKHESIWDGKNKEGKPVGSGVYLFRLKAERHKAFGKVMLLR